MQNRAWRAIKDGQFISGNERDKRLALDTGRHQRSEASARNALSHQAQGDWRTLVIDNADLIHGSLPFSARSTKVAPRMFGSDRARI